MQCVETLSSSETVKSGITLFTPYFRAGSRERQAEIDLCLQKNLNCSAVTKLVLLIDDGHLPPMSHSKITIHETESRPTYLQWVELSENLSKNQPSVLANSDIYFDETLFEAAELLLKPGRFLALSRFEKDGENHYPHPNPRWSQDVWGLLGGQLISASLRKALDIPLGVPRCDNKIAYLFAVHGWSLHNPMTTIHSLHVHETQQRNYDKKTDMTVMGGVAYVHPTLNLYDMAEIDMEIYSLNTGVVKSVKMNRSLEKWAKEDGGSRTSGTMDTAIKKCEKESLSFVEIQSAIKSGKIIFQSGVRFKIYKVGDRQIAVDSANPSKARLITKVKGDRKEDAFNAAELLSAFIPPVLVHAKIIINDRPQDKMDCQFWQYPAATERQAYQNHLNIQMGENVDVDQKLVHVYLGLPWATYIDKKNTPTAVLRDIVTHTRGLNALAEDLGYKIQVHTVCQQIHWRRLLETFQNIGVTDLHLSHAEVSAQNDAEKYNIKTHSWPLFAPNIEIEDRQVGLDFAKPVSEKKYLASFVGAHMPHYRSEIRIKLREAAKVCNKDVFIEVNSEWHFNKQVYKEQVSNIVLDTKEVLEMEVATRRYNEILSDSKFSLCPEGAGPNTLRLWESLAMGAIPVVISDYWIPPEIKDCEIYECCIFIKSSQIGELYSIVSKMDNSEIALKRDQCRYAYGKARNMLTF